MNSNMLHYLFSDAIIGLKRNKGGTIATFLFLALSMSFLGVFLLVRVLVTDVTDYLNTQLSMKVYVEQQVDTEKVAEILKQKDFVKDVSVEDGEQILEQLSFFFSKRDYLLDAFKGGKINDAIHITLTDASNMDEIATALKDMNGIEKVVYPQQLAQTLQHSLNTITLYGTILSIVLIGITFLIISITFRLALYRRERELKVKLLVGMNPKHLRFQFILEGLFMAIAGAAIAIIIIWMAYHFLFSTFHTYMPFLTPITLKSMWSCSSIAIVICIIMSLIASYMATRKWIRHA